MTLTKQERTTLIIISILTIIAVLFVATHTAAISQIGAWFVATAERIIQAFAAL